VSFFMTSDTVVSGNSVTVHYTGKLLDGSVFDSSSGKDPLTFTAGSGQVIPGFEQAVLGMKVGDKKMVTILPEEAYGPYHDEMHKEFPRDRLPSDFVVKIDDMLPLQSPDGRVFPAKVLQISETELILDFNHPLAGKTLVFEIELISFT